MAQDPRRRPPARRNGHSNEPIRLETGDFESLDQQFDDVDEDAPALPPTKVLPNDPQRAVPTGVYDEQRLSNGSESFNPPLPSDSFNPPMPSDTHPLPEVDPRRYPADRTRPGPPVGRGPALDPAFLYVDRGPGEGRNVPIPSGEMVIGRSSASGLKLSHPSVSREHAILERQGGRFFVHDAGSHNGTYVNGRQISGRVEVFGGDEIALGKAVLILRYGVEIATGTGTGTRAGTSTHNTPLTERKAFKFTVFGSAVALGILSVLVLSKLKPAPVDESKVAALPAKAAVALAARPEPRQPIAVAAPRPEPRPEPEPEVDRPEPTPPTKGSKGRGDLNLDQPTEVSAAKVFQEARKNSTAPRYDALDNNKPLKAQPKKAPTKIAYTPKAPMSSVDTSDAAEAMALYEAGDLDGAIGAAKSVGNAGLANKIAKFKTEISAAKGCLTSKDGAGAIKHYSTALAIDDELSKGWGKLGGQIRGELAKLFERAGSQALEKGDNAKAIQLLQRSLKYDPENVKAQEELTKAKSGGGAQGKAPPADDARSAADQAFDQ
ncbi:MAG TPA: FHA domain-containing protein [Myxococcales bacterium]